jgi:hypothetical protein
MTPEERRLAERDRGRQRRARARAAKAAKRQPTPERGAILPGYRWVMPRVTPDEWEWIRTFKWPKKSKTHWRQIAPSVRAGYCLDL